MVFNPVYEFESMRKILDSFLEGGIPNYDESGYNSANLYENEHGYILQFLAPGVKQSDVAVDYDNGLLKVSVKRDKENLETEKNRLVRSERAPFDFVRSYRLADGADAEKIEAKIADGLLFIHIPKTEESKPKKIEVKVQ